MLKNILATHATISLLKAIQNTGTASFSDTFVFYLFGGGPAINAEPETGGDP